MNGISNGFGRGVELGVVRVTLEMEAMVVYDGTKGKHAEERA